MHLVREEVEHRREEARGCLEPRQVPHTLERDEPRRAQRRGEVLRGRERDPIRGPVRIALGADGRPVITDLDSGVETPLSERADVRQRETSSEAA